MLSRIRFDIPDLVEQMLDHVPADVWQRNDTTFLDPAMGGGQFVRAVEHRLRQHGHSDENIRSRVLGWEVSDLHVRYAVNKHALVGQYARHPYETFLSEVSDMHFDVIVGNPPFRDTENEAKRWTLWEQFVRQSLDRADTVAMITPQSITSPGPFQMIRRRASVVNTHISQHFNVGSTFAYFIAGSQDHSGPAQLVSAHGSFHREIQELPFLPSDINDESLADIDWLTQRSRRQWRRGELHTSNQRLFSDTGRYAVMHTNAQELRTNVEHANLDLVRVAVSLSGYPRFRVLEHQYASQACMWTAFDDPASAQAFADECNGPRIQEILATFKWSGWNSREVIELL